MKKYIIIVCILSILSLLTFSGCKNENGANNGNTSGTTEKIDAIFGGDFKVVIPSNISESDYNLVLELNSVIYNLTGSSAGLNSDKTEKYTHEILIGRTNRDLSEKAYKRLDIFKGSGDDYIGYVMYSDGNNIAIAYDSLDSMKEALDALKNSYLSKDYGNQNVKSGVLLEWKYELKQLYSERDAIIMAERWQKLEKEINDKGYNGAATVKALKNLYSLYSDSIYMWMVDLYEPEIPCTCQGECPYGGNHGGGFYYSNSGRDTEGFLSDIESTMQILNFLRNNGFTNNLKTLPESVKTAIVTFVKSTQSSSDGYFYHPQWEGMVTTDERRGRDQKWAIEILRTFGEQPLYTTGGVEGSLGDPLGASSAAYLTLPLKKHSVAAVSKVMACATLEHLQSEEAFKEYLDSQNWDDAYTTGNRIGAQSTSIKAAGLLDFCIKYLNGKQKENGMWDDQLGERATNGFLKIAGIYQDAGVVIPRSKEAAEFCIGLLLSDEPDGTVCWTYNVWYALDIITRLLDNSDNSENLALSEEIRDTLRKNAPEYIKTTTEKYLTFLKDDGTFSFTPNATSSHSQGMPVAIVGKNEGDVNATTISVSGVTGYMFSALGYNKVDMYTENDYKLFISRIEELQPVIKSNSSMSGGIDFEDVNINEIFNATNNVAVGITPDGFKESEIDSNWAYAVLADEDGKYGKVLEYAKPNAGVESRVEFSNKSRNSTRHIFEFDMKFMGGEVENDSWHTRFAMYNNSNRFYTLLCYTLDDGTLALGDRNKPIAVLNPGEWYNIRFEYYTTTQDRACKIYINGEYVAEGGTSNPTNGDSAISRAFIEYRNEATNVLYRFDNVLVSSDDEAYVPPFVDAGDAIGSYYGDATYKGNRYDYDAEEPVLPSLLNNLGKLSVSDGRLQFSLKSASGADAVIYDLPISASQKQYENLCKIFELEFSYSGVSGDSPISFMLGNQKYALVKDSESGNLNIIDKYNDNKVIAVNLAPDTVYVLRFECYAYADNDIYNITKLYVNEAYVGELRSKYNNAVTKLSIVMDGTLAGTDAYVTVENVLLLNIDREYVRDTSEAPDEGGEIETVEPSPLGGGAFYQGSVVGNRFDYSSIVDGLQTDGVTSGSDDIANLINEILVYTRNNITGESYMRWNHATPSGLKTPVFVFESDFRFDGFKDNSPQQKIIIQANGISHQITPSFAVTDGVQTMTIGKMTLSEGNWYNIRFELDYEAGNLYYFLNGEYMGFDYLSKGTTTYQRVIWYYMAKQTGGSMSFDNTFEGLVEDGTICESHTDEDSDGMCDNCPLEIPKPPKPDAVVPENTLDGGVYYKGDALGNRFGCDELISGIDIGGIGGGDEVKCTDGYLRFIRNNDTGSGESYLRWNHSKNTSLTAPVFVFETDFFFTEFAVGSQTSQKIVIEANGIRHQITPVIALDGNSMNIGKLELSSDTWYNIRFELDYSAGKINYFRDGLYVGSETLSTATTPNTRVLWYYMAKQTGGTKVFDNTFEGLLEDGTEIICEEHKDSDTNGLCDICGATVALPPSTEPETPAESDSGIPMGSESNKENSDNSGWLKN